MIPEQENKFFSYILRQHGREVLKIVRKGEKALGKLARWQNPKHFNIRCRIDDVIPNSLKLRTCMKGVKTMKIIRNAERKLLLERIRQCDFTIRKCEENLNALKLDLQSKVSIEMNDRILAALFAKSHSTFFEESKNRQRQKFDRLQSTQKTKSSATNGDDTSINQKKWVMNL